MSKTLVAMAVPKPYIRCEMPLSSQFDGVDYNRIVDSSIGDLLQEMVDDNRNRDDLEKKMETHIRNYLLQGADKNLIVINCYSNDRKPMNRRYLPEGIESYDIQLDDRVADYIFKTKVDGKEYDTIDMVVSMKLLGGAL